MDRFSKYCFHSAIFASLAMAHAAAAQENGSVPPPPSGVTETREIDQHMSESMRSSIKKVVVIAGQRPSDESVTGSFDKETAGLFGGMSEGSRVGTISKDVGGVPVNIPIPVLGTLGAIYGGIAGVTKRQIQEFRDALTEELVSQDSPPLRSDGLALDAFWNIRKLPHIDSHLFAPTVEISEDTDVILYVSLDDLTIDVQGKDAIITTTATGALRRVSDGRDLYATVVQYQDRDNLSAWTDNDNALWRSYTNFARHYLGREIASDIFDKVSLNQEFQPTKTDSAKRDRKNKLKLVTDSTTPTLSWNLVIEKDASYGEWVSSIDESNTFYDIEIFDNRQLAYYEKEIADPFHTLAYELEACKTYRWSVRPSYHINGEIKVGEWVRIGPESEDDKQAPKGLVGRQASVAPAYTQDFAHLEVKCGRR